MLLLLAMIMHCLSCTTNLVLEGGFRGDVEDKVVRPSWALAGNFEWQSSS
jgi:hypothetical protein